MRDDDPFRPAVTTFLLNMPNEKTEQEARDRIQRIFYRLHGSDIGERVIMVKGSRKHATAGSSKLIVVNSGFRAYLGKK